MSRRLKNKPANIICDKEFSKEFSYSDRKIEVNKIDKIKRREAIVYKIVKQIPSDNDKWYVKYNRDSDTYYVGKEDEKKNIVMDSSDNDEGNKKRKMRKRKNAESVDEMNQLQKKQKKSQVLVSWTEPKIKKNKNKSRN